MLPKNRAPMHPGRLLAKILDEEGITQADMAERIGVSVQTINTLINEKRGMTANLAISLSLCFDASAQMWMRLQSNLDLWEAQRTKAHA